MGNKFILGADFNTKHVMFGSRISNPKGRELLKAIQKNNVNITTGGGPTYWPTDPRKIPDLIDFFITKGINVAKISIQNSQDLSSDHSPIFLTYTKADHEIKRPKIVNIINTAKT